MLTLKKNLKWKIEEILGGDEPEGKPKPQEAQMKICVFCPTKKEKCQDIHSTLVNSFIVLNM